MSTELGHLLTPAPEKNARNGGLPKRPWVKLKKEYRYQFLIKSAGRKALNELLRRAQQFARGNKWPATALVIDVDPAQPDVGRCSGRARGRASYYTWPATPPL